MKTSLVFAASNDHRAGALGKCLSIFCTHDINITKLESRPVPAQMLKHFVADHEMQFFEAEVPSTLRQPWTVETECSQIAPKRRLFVVAIERFLLLGSIREDDACRGYRVLFFIDVSGSIEDPKIQLVLSHLKQQCPYVQVLGSYPIHSGSNEWQHL